MALAGGLQADTTVFAEEAFNAYVQAKSRYQDSPQNNEAAWHFARACFDWAEFATNNSQRAAIANEGIEASRDLLSREPDSSPGQYYLAMNLGQLARTKTLGALKIVDEMERIFKAVRERDPLIDYAGPDRNLGLLYLDAPGWPASIGNKKKALEHLQQAVKLFPDYPENRLCLAEAYMKWDDRKSLLSEYGELVRRLPQSREKFSGDRWKSSWFDWQRRLDQIESKVAEIKKASR